MVVDGWMDDGIISEVKWSVGCCQEALSEMMMCCQRVAGR